MLGMKNKRDTIKGEFAKKLHEQIDKCEKKYPWQTCQDEELNYAFINLHHEIIDKVVRFCKDNNIEADDFCVSADGMRVSIPYGAWTAGTDSAMTMFRFDEEHTHRQNRSEVEPFLCSM